MSPSSRKADSGSRILALIASVAAGLFIAGCHPTDSLPVDSPQVSSVVEGNTAFALDLYRKLSEPQQGNLFVSPQSISTALAMTLAGAKGQTAEEMAKVLHLTQPQTNVHAGFRGLLAQVNRIQSRRTVTIREANSLWCQRGHKFLKDFLRLAHSSYDAQAGQLDFSRDTDAARRQINQWVERKTQRKVRDLIMPDQITTATRLVLCNAIYFKGNWQHEFWPSQTQPESFSLNSSNSIPVAMMHQTSHFKTAKADIVDLLELPYRGGDVSMIILLPKTVDGLALLEQALDLDHLRQWLTGLEENRADEVQVALPIFKLNYRAELATTLAHLGMASAFGSAADFSGLTGDGDLFLSAVAHQAFIEVDEQGTEAAAATSAVASSTNSVTQPSVFKADHPFIFLIQEHVTRSILFLGRLTDPSGH